MESSLAKLHASRAAEVVTRDAMQLHGAMGYGEETDVSRCFVDARVLSIFEGAEEVLALPRPESIENKVSPGSEVRACSASSGRWFACRCLAALRSVRTAT